jgi:hypothetical protein
MTVPADLDAELGAVGAVIERQGQGLDELTAPGLFIAPAAVELLRIVQEMQREGLPIDSVSVARRSKNAVLVNQAVDLGAPGIAFHLPTLRRKAKLRAIQQAATQTLALVDRLDQRADDIDDELAEAVAAADAERRQACDRFGTSTDAGFPLWTSADFDTYQPPADCDILGQAILRQGSLSLLMGQPGLGKSTASFALAVANVRGDRDFAGIPLCQNPRRWLFIGNENGPDRWKAHFGAAAQTMNQAERKGLRSQIAVAALFDGEASDLSMPDNENRLEATVRAAQADVVVLDPWTEIVPNEIDSTVVRAAIGSLRRAIRRANHRAATLVVCHAKAGREMVADSLGNFGAGNAQRGNRMLYSSARSALLMVPHDEDGTDLVLSLAKCNDGPPLNPRRIAFDREAFRYRVNADFDVQAWTAGLRAKTRPKRKVDPETIESLVREGHTTTKAIVEQLASRGSERSVKEAIASAVEIGLLRRTGHGTYALNLE